MAKNRKANDALWMAILQMLQGGDTNEAAAVAAANMSDIARDGEDQNDVHNVVENTIAAQKNDPAAFIVNVFDEHPEMEKELDDYLESKQIALNNIAELQFIIPAFLKEVRGYGQGGQFEGIGDYVDVEINGKVYHLLHLITEDQKERGLMDVASMENDEGALFDYSDDPQASLDFWMQNTSIPLLICFVNEQGKVISVHEGVPESENLISESSEFISYVIEVNVGENVNPGDQTSLGETIEETDPDEDESAEDEYPDLQINHLVIYGSDGQPQGMLKGGERIFSRKSTRVIIRKAKRAYKTQSDADYKALGRYLFNEMKAQDERPAEYTD